MCASVREIDAASCARRGAQLLASTRAADAAAAWSRIGRWCRPAGVRLPTALAYLRGYYRDATVGVWLGAPQIRGRFFYNDDLTRLQLPAQR